MTKLFIFAFIAIGVQLQFADVEADGKADAKKAFEKLVKVVDKSVAEGEKVINKSVAAFDSVADNSEARAKVELDKLLLPLQKQLDELVKKAGNKGKKCVKYEKDFSKISDKTVKELVDCAKKEEKSAQKAATDALQQIQKLGKDAKSIGPEIDRCSKNKAEEKKCYAKLISKIAKANKHVPVKISSNVSKVILLISKIDPTVETCLVTQVQNAKTEATEDIAKFSDCAK